MYTLYIEGLIQGKLKYVDVIFAWATARGCCKTIRTVSQRVTIGVMHYICDDGQHLNNDWHTVTKAMTWSWRETTNQATDHVGRSSGPLTRMESQMSTDWLRECALVSFLLFIYFFFNRSRPFDDLKINDADPIKVYAFKFILLSTILCYDSEDVTLRLCCDGKM